MKKLLSFALAFSLLVSSLAFSTFSVKATSDPADYYDLETCNNIEPLHANQPWCQTVGPISDLSYYGTRSGSWALSDVSDSGKGIELTPGWDGAGAALPAMQFSVYGVYGNAEYAAKASEIKQKWNEAKDFRFWIKNDLAQDLSVSFTMIISGSFIGTSSIALVPGAGTYLIDEYGKKVSPEVIYDTVTIPQGFTGYIVFPTKINRSSTSPDTTCGFSVSGWHWGYIDSSSVLDFSNITSFSTDIRAKYEAAGEAKNLKLFVDAFKFGMVENAGVVTEENNDTVILEDFNSAINQNVGTTVSNRTSLLSDMSYYGFKNGSQSITANGQEGKGLALSPDWSSTSNPPIMAFNIYGVSATGRFNANAQKIKDSYKTCTDLRFYVNNPLVSDVKMSFEMFLSGIKNGTASDVPFALNPYTGCYLINSEDEIITPVFADNNYAFIVPAGFTGYVVIPNKINTNSTIQDQEAGLSVGQYYWPSFGASDVIDLSNITTFRIDIRPTTIASSDEEKAKTIILDSFTLNMVQPVIETFDPNATSYMLESFNGALDTEVGVSGGSRIGLVADLNYFNTRNGSLSIAANGIDAEGLALSPNWNGTEKYLPVIQFSLNGGTGKGAYAGKADIINEAYAKARDIRFYIDNPLSTELSAAVQFNLSGQAQVIKVITYKGAYLINSDNKKVKTRYDEANETIIIPAGFKGYLVTPTTINKSKDSPDASCGLTVSKWSYDTVTIPENVTLANIIQLDIHVRTTIEASEINKTKKIILDSFMLDFEETVIEDAPVEVLDPNATSYVFENFEDAINSDVGSAEGTRTGPVSDMSFYKFRNGMLTISDTANSGKSMAIQPNWNGTEQGLPIIDFELYGANGKGMYQSKNDIIRSAWAKAKSMQLWIKNDLSDDITFSFNLMMTGFKDAQGNDSAIALTPYLGAYLLDNNGTKIDPMFTDGDTTIIIPANFEGYVVIPTKINFDNETSDSTCGLTISRWHWDMYKSASASAKNIKLENLYSIIFDFRTIIDPASSDLTKKIYIDNFTVNLGAANASTNSPNTGDSRTQLILLFAVFFTTPILFTLNRKRKRYNNR